MELKEKVAIVTGASKGIGAGIAKEIAKAGANVVVNYVSSEKDANKVVDSIQMLGGSAIAVQGNVSDADDVKNIFKKVFEEFGRIDILVNNAGIYRFNPIDKVTQEEFHTQFDTNVMGSILTIQEAVKYFKNGGSIINIGSMATRNFDAGTVIYTATKGAIDVITKVLAKELGNRNIRVNTILPGLTETEGAHSVGIFNNDLGDKIIKNIALGRLGQPNDIGKVAVFLASENSYWITGENISVSGGYIM